MQKDFCLLAIETSCDETGAAVISEREGRPHLLSNVVATQFEFHQRFGGIVPEIAARRQVEVLEPVIAQVLEKAGKDFPDLTAVAVVHGPGLVGSLVVGVAAAKAIALARNIPLIGVNHLEGHVYAVFMPEAGDEPEFPLLVLIASGGHSHLVHMRGHGQFDIIGRTRDDAAGEAYDKAGKLLDLPYPGGPVVAQLAEKGRATAFNFPVAEVPGWDFSFSGLKTALARVIRETPADELPERKPDIAASFQRAVVRALVDKTIRAADELEVGTLALVGGVASNKHLREELAQRAQNLGIKFHVPPLWLCTDNAAMIASAAYYKFRAGFISGLNLDTNSSLPLVSWNFPR